MLYDPEKMFKRCFYGGFIYDRRSGLVPLDVIPSLFLMESLVRLFLMSIDFISSWFCSARGHFYLRKRPSGYGSYYTKDPG